MLGRLRLDDEPSREEPVSAPAESRARPESVAQDASRAFEEHASYVWNSLRRLGVPQADLEDTTHDTFLAVFRGWAKYDQQQPIRPWLFVFALRAASDFRRRARHRYELPVAAEAVDEAPSAVEQLLARERHELAHRALEGVSLELRAVLILHELDDYSVPEIATALGIPLATAYSRLRLAREQFARAARRLSSRAK